jgi:hypothetical protein
MTTPHHHQRAERERIASRKPWRRIARLERARSTQGALQMRAPECDRELIARLGRHPVGDGGRRPVRQKTETVETPQPIGPRRPPHLDQRQGRGDGKDEERAHADGPADRRQPEPEPDPGQSKEQPGNRRHRGQRRPQPLPQNRRPCPEQPAGEHGLARAGEAVAFRGFGGRVGQLGPAIES